MRLPLVALLAAACVAPPDRQAAEQFPDSLWTFQRVGANALVVRRGFRVALFARDLPDVRGIARDSQGRVYVTLQGPGEVVRLDGEEVTRIARGLDRPHGIAFQGDTLWVSDQAHVLRATPPYQRYDTVIRGLPTGGHSTRTLLVDGDHLYVAVGSSCNICDERDPRRGAIMRYNLDGSGETLFATGLRNSVGLAVHPETGALWATNNDRDRLGDDRPPDRVNHIVAGGWYGWPQCFLPDSANPEYASQAPRCAAAIGPAITLGAHTAPLGLAFRDDYLYVALHGSWDRSVPVGYKIVRVPFTDGQPAGPPEDFLVGWLTGRQFWGRPVDLLVMPDGALLITDDESGRIYRVTWEDP